MRWVNIYEEYRNVIYDSVRVKHTYRKMGSSRLYICQYSLQSDIDAVGSELARKFYLVKTYSAYDNKPHRFDLKTGDIVRCYYGRNNRHLHFSLEQIVSRRSQEVIYPHPCLKDNPVPTAYLTLYE